MSEVLSSAVSIPTTSESPDTDNEAATSVTGASDGFKPCVPRKAGTNPRKRRGMVATTTPPGWSSACSNATATTTPPCSVVPKHNARGPSTACRPVCSTVPAKKQSASWPSSIANSCTPTCPITPPVSSITPSSNACVSPIVPDSWKSDQTKSDQGPKLSESALGTADSLASSTGTGTEFGTGVFSKRTGIKLPRVRRKGVRSKFKDRTLKSALKDSRRKNPLESIEMSVIKSDRMHFRQGVFSEEDPLPGSTWTVKPRGRKKPPGPLDWSRRNRRKALTALKGGMLIEAKGYRDCYGGKDPDETV